MPWTSHITYFTHGRILFTAAKELNAYDIGIRELGIPVQSFGIYDLGINVLGIQLPLQIYI